MKRISNREGQGAVSAKKRSLAVTREFLVERCGAGGKRKRELGKRNSRK